MAVLEKGKRNVEILKQPQYSPVSVEKQVAIIFLGTSGLLRNVPVNKIYEFENLFLTTLETRHPEILENFKKGKFEKEDTDRLKVISSEIALQYK